MTKGRREMTMRDLRKVRKCAQDAAAANTRLREAIIAAHEGGETLRDIAEFAGLSHQRIAQIVAERRE